MRFAILGLVSILMASAAALADDKKTEEKAKKPTLSGTWVREAEGFEVKFDFPKDKEDTLKISVSNGANGITVISKYTVDKDGMVKGKVADVEEKGEFPTKPPKGLEFSFKIKIEGKKATIEDFQADNADGAKPVIEGTYEKKESK